MSATVRPATPADVHEIARVHVDTWRFAYRGIVPQDFLDALDPAERARRWEEALAKGDCYILVAEDAGTICGFISGGILRDGVQVSSLHYDAEIYTLYVDASAQGRGIGRELMRALASHLAQDGLTRPVVWALAKNPWCRFYERLGGKPVAEKTIEIGGELLLDLAYGWDDLHPLLHE